MSLIGFGAIGAMSLYSAHEVLHRYSGGIALKTFLKTGYFSAGYGLLTGFSLTVCAQQAQAQLTTTIVAGQTVWFDSGAVDPDTGRTGSWVTSVRPIPGSELAFLIRANESLRQRAEALESEVLRLRSDVQRLTFNQPDSGQCAQQCAQQRREKEVVCGIKTPFNGTFIGRADTKIEALALALQKCEQSGAGLCPEKNAQCEKP
jgi:hypothetical protein